MNKYTESGRTPDDIPDDLPLTITNISVQKKNKERFSLYHNNRFLIGVSNQTLMEYSLQKGVVLTPSLYQKLKQAEELSAVKESCYRYLSRRDHASSELKKKLIKKGFGEQIITDVLHELAEKGYLDDEQFALKFANEKGELNRWGPKKIKSALYKKGLSKNIIEKVVKTVSDNLPQDQICVDLVLKRKCHFLREEDPYKRKQKIYMYLAGRGFPGSVINQSMPKIEARLDA